jgi:hypothetical protein
LSEHDRGDNDAVAATERALARLCKSHSFGWSRDSTCLRLSTAYIEQNGVHMPHSVPTLTNSLLIIALALAFLCCLHIVLIVLWARCSLNHYYFNLPKLGIATQAIVVVSQICTVGALGLLSYGLQRIAADKFVRQGELYWPPGIGNVILQLTLSDLQRRPFKVHNT